MENTIQIKKLDAQALQNVVEQNISLTQRATAQIAELTNSMPVISPNLPIDEGVEFEEKANDIRVRANDAVKINKERRMIFTRQFDAIKKTFTDQEKSIETSVEPLISWINAFNSEKLRRQQEELKAKQKELDHKNALIEYEEYAEREIMLKCEAIQAKMLEYMQTSFYQQNEETMEGYLKNLNQYNATEYNPADFEKLTQNHPLLSVEEMDVIYKKSIQETLPRLSEEYIKNINEAREKIISLAPGRLAELERIKNDASEAKKAQERIQKEQEEQRKKAEEDARAKMEELKNEANLKKMQASFETATVKAENEVAKGTQVKQKYNPQDHKEMILIIQWWVANSMPLMTIADLHKRLSFMRTAADAALNKGEVISDVTIVEDVRTRANRK